MKVKVKKLNPDAVMPTRGSFYSGGYDLYALLPKKSIILYPHETVKVGTGIALEIPFGYTGDIYARSGVATKKGLRPANCVGIIDSDYRGEIIVALHNDSEKTQEVKNGERIAQIIFHSYAFTDLEETDELSETARGNGGFGSTGE